MQDFGEAEMKKWWKEKDFINIVSEQIIHEDMDEDDIIDMILDQIET